MFYGLFCNRKCVSAEVAKSTRRCSSKCSPGRPGTNTNCQRKNMEVADDGRISPSGNLDLSRERSNSDPGRREKTIVMNGGNTVPTRRAPTFLNATEVGVSTPVAGANSTPSTPPPVRRSKLAINIGRLLRPWKWRRRKKSQKFITTSQSKKLLLVCYCNRIN